MDMARAMLHVENLPMKSWPAEAISTAVYIKNRLPTKEVILLEDEGVVRLYSCFSSWWLVAWFGEADAEVNIVCVIYCAYDICD
jgi:hypothetical protein